MSNFGFWDELQTQVGQWSEFNFGQQQSKVDPDLFLGSLAPLMGVTEEMGELIEALNIHDFKEVEDALGDIGVYLCDYATREGFRLLHVLPTDNLRASNDHIENVVVALGRLYHVTLKRHQGIRGMDDPNTYTAKRDEAVGKLLQRLYQFAHGVHGWDYLCIVHETWKKVVQKRNWNVNPTDGSIPRDGANAWDQADG